MTHRSPTWIFRSNSMTCNLYNVLRVPRVNWGVSMCFPTALVMVQIYIEDRGCKHNYVWAPGILWAGGPSIDFASCFWQLAIHQIILQVKVEKCLISAYEYLVSSYQWIGILHITSIPDSGWFLGTWVAFRGKLRPFRFFSWLVYLVLVSKMDILEFPDFTPQGVHCHASSRWWQCCRCRGWSASWHVKDCSSQWLGHVTVSTCLDIRSCFNLCATNLGKSTVSLPNAAHS